MAQEKEIEVKGQILWTESLGNPVNPAILLISGAGSHAYFWSDSFCQYFLDAGFFLIRFDHRDTGLSSPCETEYDLQTLAEDSVGVLDAYNIHAAHIIGHSMGGYIGQLMAVLYPTRLLTLTLISTGPLGETEAMVKPATVEEQLTMQDTWRIMMRNRPTQDFEKSYEGYAVVWKRLNGKIPVDEDLAHAYTEKMYTRSRYPLGPHPHHMKVMQKVAETLKDRKQIFSKITLPTLIIQGGEDYLVFPERGGIALAETLPNAQLEVIPEMGHMFFNHKLEADIAGKMLNFLQNQFK